MLDKTTSPKKKSKKVKEISFQDEEMSLGPSKPLEKKTYQNFAELYESSGESDVNNSKPNKTVNKNEGEKSYRSLIFHNKSRNGKENDAKTPENKKNRSNSESNVTVSANTSVTKKKPKHSINSEESVNAIASQDNSSFIKKKNKNKSLDLTYNPQITSTPVTDMQNKSKQLNNTKDKSFIVNENASTHNSSKKNKKNKTFEDVTVIESDTPGKAHNKRDRKKSKSDDNDTTPKEIKIVENRNDEDDDDGEPNEKLKKKNRKLSGDEKSSKTEKKKRKVLKSETENQEQIGDANNEAVSEPKKKKKNRNKNKNVERKVSETEHVTETENLSDDDEMFANAQPVIKKNKIKTTPKEGQEKPNKKGKDKKKKNIQVVKETNEVTEEKPEKSSKKWNKHNKYMAQGKHITKTTLFIENLPLNVMLKYKPILKEHFGKYGPIRNFGVIELYPMEDPRPVFSTTIRFHNEDSAEKALQEDNMLLEGKRIRVRPTLPAQQTTIVAKGKGLSEQAISTIFAPCGRLRSIRIVLKGKHSKYQTAFVEFDGPDAVSKALIVAKDASVSGKPVMVSRFEPRGPLEHPTTTPRNAMQGRGEGSDDGDSEDDD